jgi:hypothetical protein
MLRRQSAARFRLLLLALVAVAAAVVPVAAFADAANPLPTTTGTETLNTDGSVTVVLNGTWTWTDQTCSSRYGIGWSVDWWGISTAKAPSPSFSLTGATQVVPTGPAGHVWNSSATTTGTLSFDGSIQIPIPPAPPPPPGTPKPKPVPASYFHVGTYYSGEDTNLCAQTLPDGTMLGPWSATATYPAAADVPAQLCVNLYDEHGSAGKSSGNANDFSSIGDKDNSIQTNDFDPTAGGGNCVASTSLTQLGGGPSF